MAAYFPIEPVRAGRELVVVLALMGWRLTAWRDRWRAATMALVLVVYARQHFDPEGGSVVVALYLAGEGIEWLRAQSEPVWRMALVALAGLSMLMAVHGLIQSVHLDPTTAALNDPTRDVVAAWLGDRATYGAWLAMAAPAAWALGIVPWAIIAAGLVAATSSTALLALGAGLLIVLLSGRRWTWAWLILPVVVGTAYTLLMVYDPPGHTVRTRLAVWKATLAWSWETWDGLLWGHGPGSFAQLGVLDSTSKRVWHHPHNEFLLGLYEFGALTVAAGAVYVGRVAWRLWQAKDLTLVAMLAAAAVASSGHFVLHVMTGIVAVVTLGIAEGRASEVRGDRVLCDD